MQHALGRVDASEAVHSDYASFSGGEARKKIQTVLGKTEDLLRKSFDDQVQLDCSSLSQLCEALLLQISNNRPVTSLL